MNILEELWAAVKGLFKAIWRGLEALLAAIRGDTGEVETGVGGDGVEMGVTGKEDAGDEENK